MKSSQAAWKKSSFCHFKPTPDSSNILCSFLTTLLKVSLSFRMIKLSQVWIGDWFSGAHTLEKIIAIMAHQSLTCGISWYSVFLVFIYTVASAPWTQHYALYETSVSRFLWGRNLLKTHQQGKTRHHSDNSSLHYRRLYNCQCDDTLHLFTSCKKCACRKKVSVWQMMHWCHGQVD